MCLDSQDKYINCISLGWYCGTASSCSRLGLRSFSGPFDWILSDFEYVITMIDKEFDGFLLPENLRIDEDNAKCFYDIKNKFYFPHDISNDLNKDLSSIQLKYKKRISNFIEQSKKPTCYFRIVKNMKEIDYIEQNSQYIDSVIKKYNKKNKIIYNLLDNLEFSNDFKGEYYKLYINDFWKDSICLRATFSKSKELIKFCNNILPSDIRVRNLQWDKVHLSDITKSDEVMIMVDDKSKDLLQWLKNRFKGSFYIWGSGKYGTILLKFLRENGFSIKGIIDNNSNKWNEKIDGIKIIPFNNICENESILIAIADSGAVNEIKNQVLKDNTFDICTLVDIYNGLLLL